MNMEILFTLLLTSFACSLIGVFLVLRKMSMMTDAISHTVLLGIVLSFMVTHDLKSPLLMVGASVMGVLTVVLIGLLVQSKRMHEDAATGVVFPLLFSIAVIIINLGFRNVHIDIDAVLLGKLEFTVFDPMTIGNIQLPRSLWIMGLMSIIIVLYVGIFYKELKIVTFDEGLAAVLGFSVPFIHYPLMSLVSLTAVAAFDAVGSILVIALMVGPAMTALFFTNRLSTTLVSTVSISVLNGLTGYFIAYYMDYTIAGTTATVTLVVFLMTMLLAPQKGVVASIMKRRHQQIIVSQLAFLLHLKNHENERDALVASHIQEELKWSERKLTKTIQIALKEQHIVLEKDFLRLTRQGKVAIQETMQTYLS